jgi:hypothetical protein
MDSIAPLDSAFMQMRCVRCGGMRREHLELCFDTPVGICGAEQFEPVDLPRAEQHVPVAREGRVL